MDPLFYALYNYAQTHIADHYLLTEREGYQSAEKMYQRALIRLHEDLGPEEREELEKLLGSMEERTNLEGEALFFSGLRLGLALGRGPE